MPRNRKYFPHKSAVFCTSRTETGLPLVSTLNLNFILWGILGRARELFDVKVCHFTFLANHFHMLLVVNNPQDVSRFIGYLKAESSHAVNRLLGRRQRTIWQDGYDSPLLLSAHDTLKQIRYIYLNPARACLVDSIRDYPGVSSWSMFSQGIRTKACKRLSRDSIQPLWSPALTINEQKRLVANYENLPGAYHRFTLEPDAWMDCFAELNGKSREEINSRLLEDIRQDEALLKEKRCKEKKDVLGSTSLRRESMTKEYTPEKYGRRMICICYDRVIRRAFIATYRALCREARNAYESWRRGDFTEKLPAGLFSPPMPSLVSAMPIRL